MECTTSTYYTAILLKVNKTACAKSCVPVWSSNKHATVEDLAQHVKSLAHLRNGSQLREGLHNSDDQRSCSDNKRSEPSAGMYFDTDVTSTPRIHCTIHRPKTTPVMMMQHPRHDKGSTSSRLFSDYTTVAFSADNIDNCRLCRAYSHGASTRQFLREDTCNLIISQGILALQTFRREARTAQVTEA